MEWAGLGKGWKLKLDKEAVVFRAAGRAPLCQTSHALTINFIVGMFLGLRGPSKRTEYPGTRPSSPSRASALAAPAALATEADAAAVEAAAISYTSQ